MTHQWEDQTGDRRVDKDFARIRAELVLAGCEVSVLAVFSRPLTVSEQQDYNAAVSEIADMKLDLDETQSRIQVWLGERGY